MLAMIEKGITADNAEERSAALESLVAILETRGHELSPEGLDEFADVLTKLLRALPADYADKSASRLTHALIAQTTARHPPQAISPDSAPAQDNQQQDLQQELLALAQKPVVDALETHRIVARGHDAARIAALRNPGAIFARSTLTTLAELAISDLSLKEALTARHDLPEAIGDRLWPFLSEKARVTLLTARRSDTLGDYQALALEESEDGGDTPAAIADSIRSGALALPDVISRLSSEGRIITIGLVLARCADIAGLCGVHAVLSPAERPLVVVLKALNADTGVLADIVRLRARCGISSSKDSRFAAMVMDTISTAEAATLTRLMGERMELELAQNRYPVQQAA